jgi:outer membrane protein assembly factor BamB
MRIHIANVLKPQTKKQLLLEVIGILLILLLIGAITLQIIAIFKGKVSCEGCGSTDPNIYLASSISTTSSTQTFFYTINAQTGKVQHTTDLRFVGNISYQKVLNGICYLLVDFSNYHSAFATDLLAVRLSDSKVLWDYTWANIDPHIIATSTMLYLPLYSPMQMSPAGLVAIQIPSGHVAWRYNFSQSSTAQYSSKVQPSLLLNGSTIIATWSGITHADSLVALQADTGQTIWSHTFYEADPNEGLIKPVVDDDHLFLVTPADSFASPPLSAQQIAHLFELDLNSGSVLWQENLASEKDITSLHIVNHCLLLQTFEDALYVIQLSTKSFIWSYTVKAGPDGIEWVYAGNTVYGLADVINPQTFAINRVLRAWQFPQTQQIFQVNIDLSSYLDIMPFQQYIFLYRSGNYDDRNGPVYPYNDVEELQAETGALLWHKKIGQLPSKNDYYIWYLSFLPPDNPPSYDPAYNPIYNIPDNGAQNQSVIFFINYQVNKENIANTSLYAVNSYNGQVLWQKNVDQLNTDPSLHPTPTPTPTPSPTPTAITYSTPKSDHDFSNLVGTWYWGHIGILTISSAGKATLNITCTGEKGCPENGNNATFQFTRIHGTIAYGTITSTNYHPNPDGFDPGKPITAQLEPNGVLALSVQGTPGPDFCNAQASAQGVCGF